MKLLRSLQFRQLLVGRLLRFPERAVDVLLVDGNFLAQGANERLHIFVVQVGGWNLRPFEFENARRIFPFKRRDVDPVLRSDGRVRKYRKIDIDRMMVRKNVKVDFNCASILVNLVGYCRLSSIDRKHHTK
jgi:hypothetical protein